MCYLFTAGIAQGPGDTLRIGIHTGEVPFENKDIIGDAVNLFPYPV